MCRFENVCVKSAASIPQQRRGTMLTGADKSARWERARCGGATHMRMFMLSGIACLLVACGGTSNDDAKDVIHTDEICTADGDCKMDPGRVSCTDSKTAVRYEIPACGDDYRCVWSRLEQHCDLRCEDGYCITAALR